MLPPLPDSQGHLPNPEHAADARQAYFNEAARLTRHCWERFWHPRVGMFKAPDLSADAVESTPPPPLERLDTTDNGYLLWPTLYALHALAEGEWHWRFPRGRPVWGAQVRATYEGLEQYFDANMHAYSAWAFPGNPDKYYDDNALAIVVLVDCYNATLDIVYLDRAWQVMANFVFGGWDPSGNPGGVRWGLDSTKPNTSDKTVSATAFAALAAFRLAEYYPAARPEADWFDKSFMITWGYNALDWVWNRVRDAGDNLMRDGLRLEGGSWNVIPTKWTYNTGVPIRAYVEHFRLTGDRTSLSRARTLAEAAMNRAGMLFDSLVADPNRRFWYDSAFFVQHLVADGLMELLRVHDDPALRNRIWDEITRHANYLFWYVRDTDEMYFRNMRLWRIDAARYALWRHLTGQTEPRLDRDTERDSDERAKRDSRRTVKTLLANAAVARMFWKLALPQAWY